MTTQQSQLKGKFKEQLEISKVSLVRMNTMKFIQQFLHQGKLFETAKVQKLA